MSSSIRRFVRHYVEMVVAMFAGMAVLGMPADGRSRARSARAAAPRRRPAADVPRMASTMTVPMVAWMRFRGHGWRPNAEMSASMFLPTFARHRRCWAAAPSRTSAR